MGVEYRNHERGMSARIGPDIRFRGAVLIFAIWTIMVYAAGVSQRRELTCNDRAYQNLQTGQKVIACAINERPLQGSFGD